MAAGGRRATFEDDVPNLDRRTLTMAMVLGMRLAYDGTSFRRELWGSLRVKQHAILGEAALERLPGLREP